MNEGIEEVIDCLIKWKSLDPRGVPRPMMLKVKETLDDKPLIGVELGIGSGINARAILKQNNIKKLYLIDNYFEYPLDYVTAREMINPLEPVEFIIEDTHKAVQRFRDNFFDFIYIDASHEKDFITQDIQDWYPKVKRGGFLGGHDYFNQTHPDVREAVDEFINQYNLDLYAEGWDWWVIKCQ